MAKGKDLKAFSATYGPRDYAASVRSGLKALGNSWESSPDFAARCRMSTKMLRPMQEIFSDFIVTVKNKAGGPCVVWAGTKAFAAKLRAVGSVRAR